MGNKTSMIPFTKMSGTGNDFIVINNRTHLFSGREEVLFQRLCTRRVSIGADGLILVETADQSPVRMRYFNADGRESTMCGNGARCTAFFAFDNGFVDKRDFTLEAADGLHPVVVSESGVRLKMTTTGGLRTGLGILQESSLSEGGFIDTGVPHFVVFADDIESLDVENLGSRYRHHSAFREGANVDFVRVSDEGIDVRTFERGVERETLSCGTGCVASALVASKMHGIVSPVSVNTRGGILCVTFDDAWDQITLEGSVNIVYEGVFRRSPGG